MLIIGMIILVCVMFIAGCVFCLLSEENDNGWFTLGGVILLAMCFINPIAFGCLHGYTNYYPSNDKDLARVTAITMEQGGITKPHYRIEVEYLTNSSGIVETDTFYCYIENEELVRKVQNNLYKEVWIISGYKGGYETMNDFGDRLLKDIELKE